MTVEVFDKKNLDKVVGAIEHVPGVKDLKMWFDEQEGTSEVPVPPELHEAACLDDRQLEALHALADRCCALWGRDVDLEWAFGANGALYLLQSRPITTTARPSA